MENDTKIIEANGIYMYFEDITNQEKHDLAYVSDWKALEIISLIWTYCLLHLFGLWSCFSYLSTDNAMQIMGAIPNKNVNILMQTSPLPVLHWQLSSCEIFKPFSEKLTPRIWGSSLQQQWDGREKRENLRNAEKLRLTLMWIVEEKFDSDLQIW